MKKALILSMVFTLLVATSISHAEDTDPAPRKDPILAGALSWYVPGLGQFYGGAIFKGATFMVVEYALLYSLLITVAEVEVGVSGGISLGINISAKSGSLSSSEQTTAILLGTTLVVVHFLNIIDAVNTAQQFNQAQDRLHPDIGYNPEQQSYTVGISGYF
jgi:TM2 domain-containing membrane protein YozV